MAISFDTAIASPSTGFNSGTSISWSHTVGASSTLMIVVLLGLTDTITAITVGGTSILSNLIQKTSPTFGAGSQNYMFYMNNPPSGSQTISATFSASQGVLAGRSATYKGTDATSAVVDSSHVDYVTSPSSSQSLVQTTTVIASNCWMVGMNNFSNGGTSTINNSAVIRAGANATDYIYWDSNATVGTSSQSFTTTSTAAADHWGGIVASIKPAGAATVNSSMFFKAVS